MRNLFKKQRISILSFGIALAGMISVGIFMQSCNSEGDIEYTQKQIEILKESAFIGKEHNRNMQKIFDQLYIKTKLKNTEGFRFTKDNIFQEFKISTETVLEESVTNNLDKKYIQETTKRYFSDRHPQIQTKNNDGYYSSIIENNISKNLLNLVHNLIAISENQQLSIKEQKTKVDKLNKIAFSTLNEKELKIFLSGSSVACASFEYWHTNISDWKMLILGGGIPRLKGDYNETHNPYDHWLMEGMIEADVRGGIESAIGGAAVGFLTSGGVFSVPDAVLGAIAGSSVASIDKLANNMCNNYF
jgi:hypothetical protein